MKRPIILNLALSIVLTLFCAMVVVAEEDKPALQLMGDRDPALLSRVNKAVVKGVEYLQAQQKPDGSWTGVWSDLPGPYKFEAGETSLVILTLLKCGVNSHEDCIKRGFDWLRKKPLRTACEVGVLLMAIERKYNVRHQLNPKIQLRRRRIVPTQSDKDWIKEGVHFLLNQHTAGERIKGVMDDEASRLSRLRNSLFSSGDRVKAMITILGLGSAQRCGIRIPKDVWVVALREYIETQERKGPKLQRWKLIESKKNNNRYFRKRRNRHDEAKGWPCRRRRPTGVTTCAGIVCLGTSLQNLGKDCQPQQKRGAEKAIWGGLAWLNHNWSIRSNPKHPSNYWHYFYLACLEEAAMSTWMRNIGKHDWYREGAEFLLPQQKEDGSWDDKFLQNPLTDTCFALLFLALETAR